MEFVVCKVHDIPRPLAMGSLCWTSLPSVGPRRSGDRSGPDTDPDPDPDTDRRVPSGRRERI